MTKVSWLTRLLHFGGGNPQADPDGMHGSTLLSAPEAATGYCNAADRPTLPTRSPAELLFLSRFIKARRPDSLEGFYDWPAVLHRSVRSTIERLLEEGSLRPATSHEQLDLDLKVTDLKEILRQKGLPVSGLKKTLLKRISDEEADAIVQSTNRPAAYHLSGFLRPLVDEFLAHQRETQTQAEAASLAYLKQKQLLEACRLVAAHESTQVFPRDIGRSSQDPRGSRDYAFLSTIFSKVPGILSNVPPDTLPWVRLGAGMMVLWGENRVDRWTPSDLVTGCKFDLNTAARMYVFYCQQRDQIAQLAEIGARRVQILRTDDDTSCRACASLAKRRYGLNSIPEVPSPSCSSELGCRCVILVDTGR